MTEKNKTTEIRPGPKSESLKATRFRAGMKIKVFEKLREKNSKGEVEEKIQVFEGIIIACHKKKEAGATITVRKISKNRIGVEKIYPLLSPLIDKIEVLGQYKTRRAKLYYLRNYKKKLEEKK